MSDQTTIGFILAGVSARQPERLQSVFPPDVTVERVGMAFQLADRSTGNSFDANIPFIGIKDQYVYRTPVIVEEHGWQAVTIMGAPVELLNPGLREDLQRRLPIPVTTAAYSAAMSIKAYGARRVLLMSPWDESMDRRVRAYLAGHGIEAVSPGERAFNSMVEAVAFKPPEVLAYTKRAFQEAGKDGKIEAIYFQATLNYMPVLEDIERECGAPLATSRLSSLWYMLSKLGRRYSLKGGGRLLSEWPALREA